MKGYIMHLDENIEYGDAKENTYLDFNLVENLAVVNANNASDHLRHDDHVSQVSLHTLQIHSSAVNITQTN